MVLWEMTVGAIWRLGEDLSVVIWLLLLREGWHFWGEVGLVLLWERDLSLVMG
jgi:hypothetical protein